MEDKKNNLLLSNRWEEEERTLTNPSSGYLTVAAKTTFTSEPRS